MIIITGAIVATVDTLAALIDVCVAHSERSRAEPGCIAHNVHVDCENPLRLFFHEQWSDIDAVRAHFRAPDSIEFVRTMRRMGAATSGALVFEASPVVV